MALSNGLDRFTWYTTGSFMDVPMTMPSLPGGAVISRDCMDCFKLLLLTRAAAEPSSDLASLSKPAGAALTAVTETLEPCDIEEADSVVVLVGAGTAAWATATGASFSFGADTGVAAMVERSAASAALRASSCLSPSSPLYEAVISSLSTVKVRFLCEFLTMSAIMAIAFMARVSTLSTAAIKPPG